MPDAPADAAKDAKKGATAPKKGKGKLLLLVGGGVVGLLALLGGAYAFVPAVSGPVNKMLGLGGGGTEHAAAEAHAAPAAPSTMSTRPIFIEMPEIALTLPNGGRPRQLRISIAIEIIGDPILIRPTVTNPRVYDSLVLYLRTLRDGELDGALALDRIRGDLYRRLDLLLGPNVIRDVLITSLVTA